jgi:hypothetical protein
VATPIHHGEVKDGKIRFDDPALVAQCVKALDGKRVEMVLRREVKHKSDNQRRYWHGVCVKRLADHTGNSPQYLKALLKLKFLWDGESVDKGGLPVLPSTEELSMEQYRDLIDRTIVLAAEYGCVIPSPYAAEA